MDLPELYEVARYKNSFKYEVAVFRHGDLVGFLVPDGRKFRFTYDLHYRGSFDQFRTALRAQKSGAATKMLKTDGTVICIVKRSLVSEPIAWRI